MAMTLPCSNCRSPDHDMCERRTSEIDAMLAEGKALRERVRREVAPLRDVPDADMRRRLR